MASRLTNFEVPRSIQDTPGAFPLDSSDLQTVGTSAPQSLSAAVRARKDEFTRKKTIKVKVGSWNVASLSGTDKDLGLWFVKGFGVKGLSDAMAKLQPESSTSLPEDENLESVEDQEGRRDKKKPTVPKADSPAVPHDEEIGLYVLGLQEVVDIASVTEAMRPYTDPNPAKKWKEALRSCLPRGYEKVATHQLLGLLILVFASLEIAPTISNVSSTSVGTGLMGYLGNKGAVCTRIVLGESTKMTFINCHLAAGADDASLQRRIWDTNQILHRTRFAPVSFDGEDSGPEEKIGDEDFAFWFGDLNYRLDDIPGEDVRRLLLLHTRNEYDVLNKSRAKIDSELGYISSTSDVDLSNGPEPVERYEFSAPERAATDSEVEPPVDPEADPASLITTIKSLLAHDQLHAQQRQKKAFHEGWRENEIRFLPTYKYDVGSVGMFDSGEKKRSPSWCDRILYRTRTDRLMYEERATKEAEVRKKDEDMQKRGLDKADEQDVFFDYDPDTDGAAYGDDYDEDQDSMNDAELVETHDGHEDDILAEHYISHQRVLSSDHKPIECTFTVTYDAIVPDLKAKIHAEVARELDKAENEARPTITVVTENHTDVRSDAGDEASTDNITPSTSSDVNSINFGQLRYDVPKTRSITIANTGQLPAKFNFVGRDADSATGAIAPTWLTISSLDPDSPEHAEYAAPNTDYNLSPGDTHTLHLTAHVGPTQPELVAQLNAATNPLDDVLILRVASGRDHFLPLRAIWLPTCFHRSLDELVVAPATGIRFMPRHRNNHDATGTDRIKSSPGGQSRNSAPRELFALTEAVQLLTERAVADWEMVHPDKKPPWFHEKNAADDGAANGWPFAKGTWMCNPGQDRDEMKANVREALDTAKDVQECFEPNVETAARLEVLAETLVEFLISVRGGIVTPDMWNQIQSQLAELGKEKQSNKQGAVTSEETLSMVTEVLGARPAHSVSLTFLTFMLGRLMSEIAPLTKHKEQQPDDNQASGRGDNESVRRSESSTTSSTHDDNSITTSNSNDDMTSSSAKSRASTFLHKLTSRRRGTSVSSSNATASAMNGADTQQKEQEAAAIQRRKAVMTEYAVIFAPLILRHESVVSDNLKVGDTSSAKKPAATSDKQRKNAEKMTVKVMLGILEASVFNV
ncbi:Type I inositol 1,4,5-trisphosphate 5-phosphatase 2 [Cyphellophora attinorum]|uniref:Type I inositol 1,4,5-trisphosphate 5-phosphatase 2 n=1 Tax=Cyphellophora attinorum TaxID=1664694 RepID=A0A0N1H038_9EURO|nr:Type I inositol 1,4,5-trisphosphate 5-phosphatase 2 [Phialophora attinorum]KPI36926.1 Type I inositol 1,4,5-trisphosphate 5-phosphatase 2 [Phialophora attinorum]